jgi:hypothetical protein
MRIGQLRDYLDALIASGIDPNLPVCIHDEDPVLGAMEVDDAALLEGDFREDPSPKMCGFLFSSGPFLMLKSCLDYDPMLNADPRRYVEIEVDIEPPEKSWPNGHWFTGPRRKPGQP